MGEQKSKRNVEWSFDFENLGQAVTDQLRKAGISSEETKTGHFGTELGESTSAVVELDLSLGRTTVSALADSDQLISADLTYTGEIDFFVTGEAERKVRLAQRRSQGGITGPIKDVVNKIVNRADMHWDVQLTPNVPLSLDVDAGVGQLNMDLTGLKLTKFSLDNGVGQTNLRLPATGGRYPVSIDSGVGELNILILDGAALDLDIDAGVGSVLVEVPAHAAIRLTVDSGLGGVNLPDGLKKVNKAWESEGFALAAQQITINYDGGVGSFTVRQV